MHRTRIILLTTLLLTICCAGSAAAAGDVAVDGTIVIDDGDTTVTVHTDAAQNDRLAFTRSGSDGLVELNTSEGNIAFDGPPVSSVSVGDPTNGLTDVDSGSINVDNIYSPYDYLTVKPTHKAPFSIQTKSSEIVNIDLLWKSPAVDDGDPEFAIESSSNATIRGKLGGEDNYMTVDSAGPPGNYFGQSTNLPDGRQKITLPASADGDIYLKSRSGATINDFDPPDGGQTDATAPTVSARVESPDLGYDGYNMTVWFALGDDATDEPFVFDSPIKPPPSDPITLKSNGTVSKSFDSASNGQNNWTVSVNRNRSNIAFSGILSFLTPDQLTIRNGSQPRQILTDNVTFTVRFISGNEIIERTTSNGSVSLAGLNRSKRYFVTVRPDDNSDYVYRRIIVDKIGEEASVYLLKQQTSTATVEFQLEDPTGQYPPTQTRLYVEKPITRDLDDDGKNETTYAVVAGDVFGASSEFPLVVETGQRYRLRVESEVTDASRVLGAYSTQNPEVVPISIQQIKWPQPEADDWELDTSQSDGVIDIKYNDAGGKADKLDLRVYERGNESNQIFSQTVTDKSQYKVSVAANSETEWIVQYNVTRAGTTTSNRVPVGSDSAVLLPAPQAWITALSLLGIVVLAVSFPGTLSAIGGVVTVAAAGILMLLGWLGIPVASWFVAATIAVFGVVQQSNQTTI